MQSLHHLEKHNRILNERAFRRVFPEAGLFVFNLGFATFVQEMTVLLLVKYYCF